MSDRQFTFLELHLHDGLQVGPRSLEPDDTEQSPTESASTTEKSDEPTDRSGPGVLGPLLGLGALAGVAYAVRKLLAGAEPEGLDALDDIEGEVDGATDDLEDDAEDSVPIEITSPEETGEGGLASLLAGAAVLLVLFALAAKKLLSGSEEVVVED